MKRTLLKYLCCPSCSGDIEYAGAKPDGGEMIEGQLRCSGCGAGYPVIDGIPRFVSSDNYARSFGYQWNRFDRTQLDESLGIDLSRKRFFSETRWPQRLQGELILEAGCGMGRFTKHAASTGAEVVAFDYSSAIEANCRNNGHLPNVHFVQADIYRLPFRRVFNRLFCFGVLQHCPDPGKAFRALPSVVVPGGSLVVDVYHRSWKTLFWGQYYLRILTRRIPPNRLFPLVERYFDIVFRTTGRLRPLNDHVSKIASIVLGIADYRGLYSIEDAKMKELCLLDTFDKLSPRHDHPQTLRAISRWLEEAQLEAAEAAPGHNGIEARGIVPLR
jgi:SAM-dependent methyltransferase